MNKNLISLAVAAALSAPLAANAAPTLFGHLQAEIADYDRTATSTTVSNDTLDLVDASRGRLGVFGDEALAGTLKAIYRYEWKVGTDDGTFTSGSREAFVGLKDTWGEITLGSNKSAYKYFGGVSYDQLVSTALEARKGNGGMFSGIGNSAAVYGADGFLDNSIAYKGKFGSSVDFWATYVLSESSAAGVDENLVLGIKAQVIPGMLELFAAYADVASNAGATDGTNTKFGGQFTFGGGQHILSAQIEQHSDDATLEDADAYFVGYQFKPNPVNQFVAQLGEIDSDDATEDREYMALAYIHNFSANTRGTIGYRTTDSDGTVAGGSDANDVDVIAVGLRVMF